MSTIDYINRLHNYLKGTGQLINFDWVMLVSGPPNAQMHTAQAKLNGQVIATGTGTARNVAKREAAYNALSVLDANQLV